jgi:diguanylate cyclase (GGDEF)-like protein
MMLKLRLTSPGALLIFATGLAGAILLVDAFFLRPYVEEQKDAALHEVAFRTVRQVERNIEDQELALLDLCSTHARDAGLQSCLDRPAQGGAFESFASSRLTGTSASLAWLADACGDVRYVWTRAGACGADDSGCDGAPSQAGNPPAPPATTPQQVAAALQGFSGGAVGKCGLVRIGDRVALFAQTNLLRGEGGADVPGHIGLARFVDDSLLPSLGALLGGGVVLVGGDSLPSSALAQASASEAYWPVSDDQLGVAWLASDAAGRHLGYFRADVPVSQISRQAAVARRIILIIMALSVGLVSLIITGTHILVAGPVVRLLRRLQQLDSGQGTISTLTRDLHGEPLLLARKLESAFERLAHMSKTDPLTALANRTHFHEVLDAFYHQARRYNRPLSVIVLDVDYFKAVNDTAGHQAGDEVLKWVGSAIEKACRKADLPARMGGDEFAVLLPETPCLDAQHVAERIRQNISGEPVVVGGLTLKLTASIGVADLNCGEIDGPQKMVVHADRALYAAKEAGRNRVMLAHDLEGPGAGSETRKVEVLYKKLAGLDGRFKDLFLHALEEVVSVMEQRDPHMADHARKVQHYAELIAYELGLPRRVVQRLRVSAMMHDIGMLAIPDAVILQEGPLDEDQTRNLRRHPLLGVRIMERMEFLEHEIPAVRYHHERYDGGGYPEGLIGPAIPLTARILAVADAFCAMTSPRTFRDAKPLDDVLGEIQKGAGVQFDPAVVEAFLAVAARLGASITELPGDDEKPSPWRETLEMEEPPRARTPGDRRA